MRFSKLCPRIHLIVSEIYCRRPLKGSLSAHFIAYTIGRATVLNMCKMNEEDSSSLQSSL